MDKGRRNEQKQKKEKYLNNYLHELYNLNAGRMAIAFGLILLLELFITVGRITGTEVQASIALSMISALKLVTSIAYLLYYFICRRKYDVMPPYFHKIIYASLILLGVIQSYLLYDELLTADTIYNHLYYLIILSWAMIYPPSKIFPLIITVTITGYIILFTFGTSPASIANNIFALTVFSLMSPVASYVIYRNHFEGYINKEKLNEVTLIDYLTNIYNRRGFNRQVDILNSSYKLNDPMAAIMIDIDSFKLYNDNYGHSAGDRCLESIASIFPKQLTKAYEVYARIGGEEFAVALFGCCEEEVTAVAETLRAGVEALAIPHEYSRSINIVTISLGAYCIIKDADFSMDELLKQADENLYKAKANGGNCVVCTSDYE